LPDLLKRSILFRQHELKNAVFMRISMNSSQIRQKFFDFFITRGHTKVASSSLIPAQDPTLLFTNAGMNQFTDVFLGKEKRSYTRAVSIQKCVRAGGKHNDLENVGFTKRHLTFFEMMGNFSFGDYFKKDAIHFAWDFLTKEMNLPVEKLHATVYKTDDEAYTIWQKEIGIPAERIHRLGEKDNFWQMGETGPCGPCSEIHIDRGPDFGCKDEKKCGPACDCDRFLEIWNLVFMQFDRQPDGTDKSLKQTGVDTGMGLERLCSVVQNVDSVYHTDLFMPIIKRIEELTGKSYAQQDALTQAAFHVLADHIRSSTMIIADGGAPSNEGRGYVLRKIIRRAALFAQKLTDKNIFPELSRIVVEQMGDIYPELKSNATLIYKILESEISKFSANLVRGQAMLEKYFQEHQKEKIVSGQQAFKLYDTYGFPIELIRVMSQEKGFTIDEHGFEQQMAKQQEQSGKKTTDELNYLLPDSVTTEFTGYKELETLSKITHLIYEDKAVDAVPAGETCWIITQKSPYFIVGGGQVPDQGTVVIDGTETPLLQVRYINNAIGVQIKTPVALRIGTAVTSKVDAVWRTKAMKNHTATHMLQSALIELFGKQIKQSGSLVHPDYLRFDFTYHENLSAADLQKVEDLVNEKIQQNIPVTVEYMKLPEALKRGALAFFGDKYNPEQVRLVEIPHFSAELCGGTHVHATGDIGVFKITDISALSAGHRRITAVTGPGAVELFQETFAITKALGHEFKVQREQILDAIAKQKDELKKNHHEIKQLKKQLITCQLPLWLEKTEIVNDTPFLYQAVPDATSEELKEIAQLLGQKKPGFYFLTSMSDGKGIFVAYVDPAIKGIDLKSIAAQLKDVYGIKGGGSGNFLQGGAAEFPKSLHDNLKKWIK
jgi:alanyl-tRNA synthetase